MHQNNHQIPNPKLQIPKRLDWSLGSILLGFSCVLLFSSCNSSKIQYGVTNGKPEYGDYYIASSIGDATYLNPVLATDTSSGSINNLIYNGLVKYDKNIKLTGDLAEKWDVSKDGLSITFYLRKNIKWHDGVPFTAEDVKFTFEKLTDPNIKTPYSSDYMIVKSLTIEDPYKLKITYKEPFAPALESWGIGILPKHIFEKGDFNTNPANRTPVGTGPYKFKEWKTDEKIVLEPNPDYFEGAPYLAKYIYRIIPDQSVEFLELRNESIDEMGLTPDQWKAYSEFFNNYNKFRYPSFSYTYLGFNMKSSLFSNKEIRKAVAHAVNKKDIIDGVLLGMGKEATGPYPVQSWAYNNNTAVYEFNPDKSKSILINLGYTINKDGYMEKDNKILEFTLITNQGNKLRSLAAEIIQSQLKKAGIKMNIRIVEWSAFIHDFVDKRDFDAVILGWSLGRDPDQFAIWNSKQTKEGQYNFVSYSNPEVDSLLETGRKTFDFDKRQQIYKKLHSIIADDIPYIFLYYPESLVCIHKRFKGPEVAPLGIGWNFFKWWVPKEEQKYTMTQ